MQVGGRRAQRLGVELEYRSLSRNSVKHTKQHVKQIRLQPDSYVR